MKKDILIECTCVKYALIAQSNMSSGRHIENYCERSSPLLVNSNMRINSPMKNLKSNTAHILLDQKSLMKFKPYLTVHTYQKNEYVFQASTPKKHFYILVNGRVKLCRVSSAGREVMQWFCFPGEVFGLSEISDRHQHAAYAQCCENSEVYAISLNQFQSFISHSPELAMKVIEQLSERLKVVGDSLLNFTSDSVKIRLVKLLIRLNMHSGMSYKKGVMIDVKLTHKEISDMVGACRQSITTVLGELKSEGYVQMIDSHLYIPSVTRLEKLIDKLRQEEKESSQISRV